MTIIMRYKFAMCIALKYSTAREDSILDSFGMISWNRLARGAQGSGRLAERCRSILNSRQRSGNLAALQNLIGSNEQEMKIKVSMMLLLLLQLLLQKFSKVRLFCTMEQT